MSGPASSVPPAAGLPGGPPAPRRPGVPLWLGWPIAHMLPLGVIPAALSAFRDRLAPPSIAAAGFPAALALLGLGQGLALHGRLDRPFRWTLATTAGLALGEAVGVPLASWLARAGTHDFLALAAAHAAGAGVVAACQARALEADGRRARAWIGASAAAGGAFAGLAAPFWADAWLPGHLAGEPPGARGLTTLLRVAAAAGFATVPALGRLLDPAGGRGA